MKKSIYILLVSACFVCTMTACGSLDSLANKGSTVVDGIDQKIKDGIETAEKNNANTSSDVFASDNVNLPSVSDKNADRVTQELKDFLDSYEACVDRYVAFMKKYQDSDYSASMMNDYFTILEEYYNFAEKAERYNEDNMSDEDLAYYVEVISRVSQKLLSVAT